MKKVVFALAALGIFTAAPAQAATDCNAHYLDFWQKFADQGASAKLTGEQVATLNRAGLRAYDACQSGDEFGSTEFWQKFADTGSDSKALEEFIELTRTDRGD